MKKFIVFLLATALCLSMAACGGTGYPDHDYVLALMEKGDYDMAIQVLEHLRDQAGGTPVSTQAPTAAPTEVPTAAPTEVPTEAPTEVPQPVTGDRVQIAINLVSRFMEEKGNTLVQNYEKDFGAKARDISVSHAMEYQLADWDKFNAHFLLVCLEADVVHDNIVTDKLYLLQDLNSGIIYDSSMLHDNISDPAATMEDVCLRAITAYISHLIFNTDQMWSEMETREGLSSADIAAINEALK